MLLRIVSRTYFSAVESYTTASGYRRSFFLENGSGGVRRRSLGDGGAGLRVWPSRWASRGRVTRPYYRVLGRERTVC